MATKHKAIVCWGQSNMQGFWSNGATATAADERFQNNALTFPGFPGIWMFDPYADSPGTASAASVPTDLMIDSGAVTFANVGGSPATFTITAASWTSRPQAASTVTVSGSTVSPSNNGTYTVISATATVITCSGTIPTAGADTVTIRSSTFGTHASYTASFTRLLQTVNPGAKPRINNDVAQTPTFVSFGPEMSLAWNMSNFLGEPIFVIKLAIHATVVTPRNLALPALSTASGFINTALDDGSGNPHNDWAPTSEDKLWDILYKSFFEGETIPNPFDSSTYTGSVKSILAAGQADCGIAAGDTMEVIGIFSMIGEGDASVDVRAPHYKAGMIAVRDASRNFLEANGYARGDGKRIPWIMGKVHTSLSGATSTSIGLVNDGIDDIASDDPWSGKVDTSTYDLIADNIHYTQEDQITFGDDLASEWLDVVKNAPTAAAPAPSVEDFTPRPTREEVRDNVRVLVEKGSANSDIDNDVYNLAIKRAQEHILNEIGDKAWFARNVSKISWSTTSPDYFVDLPEHMLRVLRIQDSLEPALPISWAFEAYVDGGRPRIKILDSNGYSGTFWVHYISRGHDLETDGDMVLIPREHQELLEVAAAYRVAIIQPDSSLAAMMREREAVLMNQLHSSMNKASRMMHRKLSGMGKDGLGEARYAYQRYPQP